MIKILKRLQAVPQLLAAAAILREDVRSAWDDERVRRAVERFRADPAIAPLAPRISAEWRAVEEAFDRLR
jgi:hypothetical protein